MFGVIGLNGADGIIYLSHCNVRHLFCTLFDLEGGDLPLLIARRTNYEK